jgi:hypothetical protein
MQVAGVALPPVIQSVVPIKEFLLPKVELKEDAPEEPKEKQIVIIHSKPITDDDKKVLKEHGRYLQWSDKYINIPFKNLPPHDYLLIDVHNKSARIALGYEELKQYNVVCLIQWFHASEEFIQQTHGNPITNLPKDCVSKVDFDTQLLQPKIKKPNVAKRVLNFFLQCVLSQ